MRKRILIAEDILEQRELLKLLFRAAPFDVVFAEDGSQAVRLFREACAAGAPFALLLLDGAMPEMSGIAAAEALKDEISSCGTKLKFLTNLDVEADPLLFARLKLIKCDERDVWKKNEMSEDGLLVSAIMRELEGDERANAQHH